MQNYDKLGQVFHEFRTNRSISLKQVADETVSASQISRFERGEEKGMFEFGGSTVVLLLKKDAAVIDSDIMENSAAGAETRVRIGEVIGRKA